MKHFVDTVTYTKQATVIHRTRHPTREAALAEARRLVKLAFKEQATPDMILVAGLSPAFTNDFGEKTYIHAVSFGDAAQVREGRFAI